MVSLSDTNFYEMKFTAVDFKMSTLLKRDPSILLVDGHVTVFIAT